MRIRTSERARHVVLRAGAGETLPDALHAALAEAQVGGGWLRATGVLEDVELRIYDGVAGAPGAVRRIVGPVDAVSVEGGVGVTRGEPQAGLRAVLARETDAGLQTLAGEIVSARIVALEAVVLAFDDLPLARALDATGLWMFTAQGTEPVAPRAAAPAPREEPPREPAPRATGAWADAAATSAETELREAPRRPIAAGPPAPGAGAPMPQRPQRPQRGDEDQATPESGDVVEHFAFGRGDVLKSDGERLHIRLDKDGRIREIALDMLKVTLLSETDGKRRYRLERKL